MIYSRFHFPLLIARFSLFFPTLTKIYRFMVCTKSFMSSVNHQFIDWTSSSMRTSGAFKIEDVERAPQNKIKEGFKDIKDAMIGRQEKKEQHDKILRTGDSFRLRSVKWPDYELGITSNRVKDDFCKIALRKVENSDNTLCMQTRFSVKFNALSVNLK